LIALVVVAVTDVAAIVSDILEIRLMGRLIERESVPVSDVDANDDRQTVVGSLLFAAYVVAAVLFIRWFHAAYANLKALGQPNPRYGPGWAIGGWFVPILNVWRPKQIANDIWRGSDPAAPALHDSAWTSIPVPGLLTAWWITWIVSAYVANLGFRTWWQSDTASDIRTADLVDVAGLALDIVAAVLAVVVVRRLTARQAERARAVAGAAADAR
jgi:hypothetical protein